MHTARCASSRDPAQGCRPFRAPSASIASARQHLLPRPASPAELPRMPLPRVLSEFRRRDAPPQDPAPAARTARAPVAETSAAPLRCSRLPASAGTLPRLLSPVLPGYLPRDAPPHDPAPAARTARAPVAAISAAPPLRFPRLASAAALPRLLLPPVLSGSRPRAAPPQDPAPAARTAHAPAPEASAAPLRCSRL